MRYTVRQISCICASRSISEYKRNIGVTYLFISLNVTGVDVVAVTDKVNARPEVGGRICRYNVSISRKGHDTESLLSSRWRQSLLLRRRQWCEVLRWACLYVCLSACISQKWHVQTSRNFLYILSVAVIQFSSDDNAICYVLPVLCCSLESRLLTES